jgi:hypothetical protein
MLRQNKDIHEDIVLLLPWLVNDSLSGKERERVLEHLLDCDTCRETRDEIQSVTELIAEDDAVNENYQPGLHALQRRIDAAERDKQVLADFELQASNWFAQLIQRLSWPSMRYVTATLVLMVGVVLLSPALMPGGGGNPQAGLEAGLETDSPYKTLTSPVPLVQGSYHRVLITFESGIESEVIREMLIKTNAKIVRNSDQENSFVVDLEIPSSVSKTDYFARIRDMDAVISVVAVTNEQ